jgi:hypothetical protein
MSQQQTGSTAGRPLTPFLSTCKWPLPFHLTSLNPPLKQFMALTPATKSTYGAGLLRFTQFCDKYKIPESDWMPASFLLLVAFISEHVGSVSGKTIRGWLSGLKAWHDTYHAEWCSDDRWLQMAQVTANKEGTAFRLKRRDPITLDHLLTLYEGLDLTSPAHAACWAIAACSFWGVCRFVFLLHMHQCHLTFP